MTLETSAVLAVLEDGPERAEFVALIGQSPRRLISAVSVLEAAMVLEGRQGDDAGANLDLFLHRASIETVASIKNSSWWLVPPSGALDAAVTPPASTLETARRMLWRSGPASLCCLKGAISRPPMLPV
jgi:hypothetical protein